ncbi:MAG: MCE family protein [Candidatus Caenarcaniphilales bacterium]|nr:MCE family protein [Candidatus Caenarcaniphilales bacterium]
MISAKTGIRAFQVGLYSLIAIVGIAFAYLWVNHFRLKPEYSFYVSFIEPKYIRKGTEVVYRGIPVGKVSDIKFSKDFERTLLKLDIDKKNLILNKNINILIQELNFVGKKTVTLLPSKLISDEYIQNGDLIQGIDSPGFVELQMYSNKLLASMDSLMSNKESFNKVGTSLNNIDKVVNHYNCLADKLDFVLEQERPAMKLFFGSPLKEFSCNI